MAARPTWKCYLKVSLVNISVRVFPATDSAATRNFNQLHAECQNRIQQKRWHATCETEVSKGDPVKGYDFEKLVEVAEMCAYNLNQVIDQMPITRPRSSSGTSICRAVIPTLR